MDTRFGRVFPVHALLIMVVILFLLGILVHLASKGRFGMKPLPINIELTPQ